jgi:hypothetical protein
MAIAFGAAVEGLDGVDAGRAGRVLSEEAFRFAEVAEFTAGAIFDLVRVLSVSLVSEWP